MVTRRWKGPQRKAVDSTVKALQAAGGIELTDAAIVAAVRGLADAVDADPTNAALWRELRAMLDDLRETASAGVDSDAADFLISIQTPRGRATLVDAENT